MNVAILYDGLTDDSRADALDALAQCKVVSSALRQLGHRSWRLPVLLDLAAVAQKLEHGSADLVFNLVESLAGEGRLISLVPALLETLGIPFTGCGAGAMFLTTNKRLAKRMLQEAKVATPRWYSPFRSSEALFSFPCTAIIKPVWEDASVGISDEAVVRVASEGELRAVLNRAAEPYGEVFAEEFVDGREFNLSVLSGDDGPEVLPPAEIRFVDYPTGKPRIVGYEAKWRADSFEYRATVRTFDFTDAEAPLLARMGETAKRCWELFELRGYGRVDFRVDEAGRPWVLEVNANPCLSPDAGFLTAAKRAGLTQREVVERIVSHAKPARPEILTGHASNPSRI